LCRLTKNIHFLLCGFIKALSHEPTILFLDEPTAVIDIELRKDMSQLVRQLCGGATIILTTRYIEEAEGIAEKTVFVNSSQRHLTILIDLLFGQAHHPNLYQMLLQKAQQ
jgi:ABC-2 type transport system ATP-binding protein